MNEKQKKLLESVEKQEISEVLKLIKEGVSPNFFTGNELLKSPLHYAVNLKNMKMVRLLVEKGKANIDESVLFPCSFLDDVRCLELGSYLVQFLPKNKN